MTQHLETVFGNPSTDNQVGQPAADALEKARAQVAALINAEPKEVVFTSGGTEADNHALKGVAIGLREKGRHIITSNIEHKSVLNSLRTLRLLDYRVTSLDVDQYGLVDPAAVERAITPETILISVMLANNEIGTIEPIADIARIAQKAQNRLAHRRRGRRRHHPGGRPEARGQSPEPVGQPVLRPPGRRRPLHPQRHPHLAPAGRRPPGEQAPGRHRKPHRHRGPGRGRRSWRPGRCRRACPGIKALKERLLQG